MQIVETAESMKEWSARARKQGQSIGFVPTLGCLHHGHAHLLRQALDFNDLAVLSVFVNPLQFRKQAYEAYPRRLQEDLRIAQDCGVDVVFVPDMQSIYPEAITLDWMFALQDDASNPRDANAFRIDHVGKDQCMDYVRVSESLVMRMDGNLHPWHFDGVATVVKKLFQIVEPTRAYFGEKDIQQLAIVQSMSSWLGSDTTVVGVPVVRDPDGLSSSSRLVLLNKNQRSIAAQVAKIIQGLANQKHRATQSMCELIGEFNSRVGEIETHSDQLEIDSIVCVDPMTLENVGEIIPPAVIYVAYLINGIRLAEMYPVGR